MSSRHTTRQGASGFPRSLRVNQVLREILAEDIERLADADERLRLVTVTAVDTSPDLRNATVFLSSLGEEARSALDERRGALQHAVARQSRMKRTPHLQFAVDPAIVAGSAVEDALHRLRDVEHRGDAGEPDAGSPES